MGIVLKEQGDFTPAPEGTHLAICNRIVDVGTQPDSGFGPRRKIIISWELPHEHVDVEGKGAQPMGVSKIYTFSLHKQANLRQDLERWRTRAFNKDELKGWELKTILGKPCQVVVVHTESGKAKVDIVSAMPKGTTVPGQFNPSLEYTIDQGKDEVYQKLPEWIQKMCLACAEWAPSKPSVTPPAPVKPTDQPPDVEPMDDVPF